MRYNMYRQTTAENTTDAGVRPVRPFDLVEAL